ncbi:hypothetical protein [Nocardia sp. NPDC049707]|uniref:hypothetical protein n=1 Tax=Nocardia sp. NPDC049707 TaxID=3154735 RepID=UPI0034206393
MNRIAISMTMLIPPLFLVSLALAQPVSAAPPNDAAAVALPSGPAAIATPGGGFPGSEVVFGECTGSACSTPQAEGGPMRVPDPLRAAPLVVNVAPDTLGLDVALNARVHIAPHALGVAVMPDAALVNIAPSPLEVIFASNALRAAGAPDAVHANISSDELCGNVTLEPPPVNVASDAQQENVTPDALHVDVAPDAVRADRAPTALRTGNTFDAGAADGGQTPISDADAAPLTADIARADGTGSASSLPRIVSDLMSRLRDLVRRAPLPMPR